MSHTVESTLLVLQTVQMEARNLSFWASCCQPGRRQTDRQTVSGGRDSQVGGPAQPPAPSEHGTGAERQAGRHGHSLLEVATDTFGLLLRKARMMSRVLSSSLGKAKAEQHRSGQERAGRAGGQAAGKTRALCPAPRDATSPCSRLAPGERV